MNMRSAGVGVAFLIGFFICSCGSVDPGPPSPPSGQVSPNESRAGAPKVPNPRSFVGRDQDPCQSLLTPEQVIALGVRPESSVRTNLPSGTPNCRWGGVREGRIVNVAAYASRDLLVDSYRNRPLPIFVPTTIAGLPAVVQQGSPTSISCTVTTGVAEGQALDVGVDLFEGTDSARRSCDDAITVSATVIGNLPPAS